MENRQSAIHAEANVDEDNTFAHLSELLVANEANLPDGYQKITSTGPNILEQYNGQPSPFQRLLQQYSDALFIRHEDGSFDVFSCAETAKDDTETPDKESTALRLGGTAITNSEQSE